MGKTGTYHDKFAPGSYSTTTSATTTTATTTTSTMTTAAERERT